MRLYSSSSASPPFSLLIFFVNIVYLSTTVDNCGKIFFGGKYCLLSASPAMFSGDLLSQLAVEKLILISTMPNCIFYMVILILSIDDWPKSNINNVQLLNQFPHFESLFKFWKLIHIRVRNK